MVCALFGINLWRFRANLNLMENGPNRSDIQDISNHSGNELYRPLSNDRYVVNGKKISPANKIKPSMSHLPPPKDKPPKKNIDPTNKPPDKLNIIPLDQSPKRRRTNVTKQDIKKEKHITPTQSSASPVPMGITSIIVDNDDSDVNYCSDSNRSSYPPPPYVETIAIKTLKQSRNTVSSPNLATFKPDEDMDSGETPANLRSSWDLIIEHRQNISRLPNNKRLDFTKESNDYKSNRGAHLAATDA